MGKKIIKTFDGKGKENSMTRKTFEQG